MRLSPAKILAFALISSSVVFVAFGTHADEQSRDKGVTVAELVGVDADGNGVRDDVDAFIARTWPFDPEMQTAAEMFARAIQPALGVDLALMPDTTALAEAEARAGACASDYLGRRGGPEATRMMDQVWDQTYNTRARNEKRDAFRARARTTELAKLPKCSAKA